MSEVTCAPLARLEIQVNISVLIHNPFFFGY